jgi:CheY-like chemotaxis protein
MDIFMPGVGGINATKEILSMLQGTTYKPIIIGCSADSSENTVRLCKQAGITDFVKKPVERNVLLRLYHVALMNKQKQRRLARLHEEMKATGFTLHRRPMMNKSV